MALVFSIEETRIRGSDNWKFQQTLVQPRQAIPEWLVVLAGIPSMEGLGDAVDEALWTSSKS